MHSYRYRTCRFPYIVGDFVQGTVLDLSCFLCESQTNLRPVPLLEIFVFLLEQYWPFLCLRIRADHPTWRKVSPTVVSHCYCCYDQPLFNSSEKS